MRFFWLFCLITFPVQLLGESTFSKSCQQALLEPTKVSEVEYEQINWLTLLFKTKSCEDLRKKISKLNSLSEIIPPVMIRDNERYPGIFKPNEMYESQLISNIQMNDLHRASGYFWNLALFTEFKNLKHIVYENVQEEGRNICKTLDYIPSIKSISLQDWELSQEDISCIKSKDLQIFILGRFTPSYSFYEIKDYVYGINNYLGNIKELYLYKRLKFLGLYEYIGNSSLKVLTKNRNLSHLELNVKNIKNLDEIAQLLNIKFLSLNCFESEAYQFKDFRNCTNSLKDISFLRELVFLKGLDLSSNEIQDLRQIGNLTNLEYLSLRNNSLIGIAPLRNLKKLKYLDLSKNNISSIDSLINLKNLEFLNISYNKISEVKTLNSLNKIRFLSIKNSPDLVLDNYYPSSQLELLNIDIHSNNHRHHLRNSELEILRSLDEGTEQKYWPEKIFFEDFIFQDESESKALSQKINRYLKRFKSLKILSMRGREVQDILDLSNSKNLKYLDLSYANGTIGNNLFLPGEIEYLNLRNSLREFYLNDFNLKKLKFLNIGQNKIRFDQMDIDAPLLKELHLDSCNLELIPNLSRVQNLFLLELQDNMIQFVGTISLPELQMLDLGRNKFKTLPNLANLPKLNYLAIYQNFISNLEDIKSMLGTNNNFNYFDLDLEHNKIKDLSIFQSQGLKKISISVEGNQIFKNEINCPTNSPNLSVNKYCSSL